MASAEAAGGAGTDRGRPESGVPLVELRAIRKGGDGPHGLRIRSLALRAGERLAIAGLDAFAAEAAVLLITGGTLPDEGEVRVFGQETRAIETPERWIPTLDRFGLVSERAALAEGLSLAQSIAVPLTLDLFPIPDETGRAVRALAAEAGLAADRLERQPGGVTAEERLRARLARALALSPDVLLLESPTTGLDAAAARRFARDLAAVATRRGAAVLAFCNDPTFGRALGGRQASIDAATGLVTELPAIVRWIGRLLG